MSQRKTTSWAQLAEVIDGEAVGNLFGGALESGEVMLLTRIIWASLSNAQEGAEAELLALRPLWDAALAWYRVVDDQVWGDELSPETLALVEAVRDRLVEEAG